MNSTKNNLNKTDFRKLFGHVENGEIYLNHAAVSPLPKPTIQAIKDFLHIRENGPVEDFENWMKIVAKTREKIAALINSEKTDFITFMGNTSDGISAVAEGYPWEKGDEIILNTLEFPANIHPFRILENRGVKLKYAEPDKNGYLTPGSIQKKITPKTRMLSISAVQYLNGFKAELETIGSICKSNNIFFVVDGIQALGVSVIDVQKMNIDALATGAHKWLMSPMGTGFLYLSVKAQQKLSPAKTGWLSVENPWELTNFNQPWKPISKHLETGTFNTMGIIGLNSSLSVFLETGIENIQQEILKLTNAATEKLRSDSGVKLLSPAEESLRAGIVTFAYKNIQNPDEVVLQLKKQQITLSAREGYFRISPHFYNTQEEIEKVLDRLLKL